MATTELANRAKELQKGLAKLYPDAACALLHDGPLQLLAATILSAQCTDAAVNKVTPALFARFPDAAAFAGADRAELETLVKSTGFYRNKAKHLQECGRLLVERHGGAVPRTMAELTALPGVARKTANVVLGNCFGQPGIAVDTHVGRLSRRMGLTAQADPVKVERELDALVPRAERTLFSHRMILHGRQVCASRAPDCDACGLARQCLRIGVEA